MTVNPGPTSALALSGTPASVDGREHRLGDRHGAGRVRQHDPGVHRHRDLHEQRRRLGRARRTTRSRAATRASTPSRNAYTLKTAGSRTVTATDTPTSSITGTSGAITVNAGSGLDRALDARRGARLDHGERHLDLGRHGPAQGRLRQQPPRLGRHGGALDHAGLALGRHRSTRTAPTRPRSPRRPRRRPLPITGTLNASALAASADGHVRARPDHELRRERPRLGDGGHRHQRQRHREGCVRQHHAGVHRHGQPDEHRPAGAGSRLARVHRRRRGRRTRSP